MTSGLMGSFPSPLKLMLRSVWCWKAKTVEAKRTTSGEGKERRSNVMGECPFGDYFKL